MVLVQMDKISLLFIVAGLSLFFLINVTADTMESDLFEAREVKLHVSYGFGHDFRDVPYKPRGIITIKNFRGPRYTIEQDELTLEEISKMEELAKEDGNYYLALTMKSPTGDRTFRTFFPLRSVLEGGLLDEFRLHLNPSGDIFSISYHIRKPPVSKSGISGDFPMGHHKPPVQRFTTAVTIKHGEVGPVPDTGPYLEKLEMERLSRERGDDGRDNRSFFAKYWMYILPVGILVLLSSAQSPEGGGN